MVSFSVLRTEKFGALSILMTVVAYTCIHKSEIRTTGWRKRLLSVAVMCNEADFNNHEFTNIVHLILYTVCTVSRILNFWPMKYRFLLIDRSAVSMASSAHKIIQVTVPVCFG